MRPICHTRNQPMLDRVDVDVIDTPRKICFIADEMFPISPLPDSSLTFALPTVRATLTLWQSAREYRFDQPPSQRKIAVSFWQRPDSVNVLRQYHDCIDSEVMALTDRKSTRLNSSH